MIEMFSLLHLLVRLLTDDEVWATPCLPYNDRDNLNLIPFAMILHRTEQQDDTTHHPHSDPDLHTLRIIHPPSHNALPPLPHQHKSRHDGFVLARQMQLQQQRRHADEGDDREDQHRGRRLAFDVGGAEAGDGVVREVVEEG